MRAIRVQFKPLGKRYYFSVGKLNVTDKTMVIVNTLRLMKTRQQRIEVVGIPLPKIGSTL